MPGKNTRTVPTAAATVAAAAASNIFWWGWIYWGGGGNYGAESRLGDLTVWIFTAWQVYVHSLIQCRTDSSRLNRKKSFTHWR